MWPSHVGKAHGKSVQPVDALHRHRLNPVVGLRPVNQLQLLALLDFVLGNFLGKSV